MKVNVVLFLVITLILPVIGISQQNYLYKSIEEAQSVSVDSVFRLDLSKKKLTELPKEVLAYFNLRELYLTKNKLTKLPSNFKELTKLEVLDISKNELTKFPIPLCSMVSLRQLFMGRNKMTSIPDCIGQLENLEVLDIWYNQITTLPNSISKLKKLKSLDLRGVNLSQKTQSYLKGLLPWAKIEFDAGCDCAH